MTKPAPQVSADVRPNLIPMIDIMFLMLLFFMLGADMSQREIEEVRLPAARSAKDDKGAATRLTVNVYHVPERDVRCVAVAGSATCRDTAHWHVGVSGRDCTAPDTLRAVLREKGAVVKQVMVRADRSAPYGRVQDVFAACAAEGLYQIECGAAATPE